MSVIIMTIMIWPTLPKKLGTVKSVMTQSPNTMGLTVNYPPLLQCHESVDGDADADVTHSVCRGRQCSCLQPPPPRRTAGLHVWAPAPCTLCCAASRSPNCTPTTRSTLPSRHPLNESDTDVKTNTGMHICSHVHNAWVARVVDPQFYAEMCERTRSYKRKYKRINKIRGGGKKKIRRQKKNNKKNQLTR